MINVEVNVLEIATARVMNILENLTDVYGGKREHANQRCYRVLVVEKLRAYSMVNINGL